MIWWYQHHGRIAYDGENYASYFCEAISVSEGGCINIHEGDRMQVVGPSGSVLDGHDSFQGGCSHSWNTRIGVINSKGMDAIGDGVMNIWFTKEFREKNPDTIARMRATLVANKPAGYIGCCSAIRDMDQRWAISNIALPSLIIAGRSDNATPLKDSEFMKGRIAGSELVALEAGHISNVEQKAAFNAALEKFLARN